MHLCNYEDYLPKDKVTNLKINISWHKFYPACSTTPWQLDGVIKTLLADGYKKENITACHNRTVVVSDRIGEVLNKQKNVTFYKYGLKESHLNEPEIKWIKYTPRAKMLVLDKVYPDGIYIPEKFIGQNILHLPTMKTHVFTTMTGAMKNAFGGLLNQKRHWTHSVIHETLVDLLAIQKEIHTGIFAVMDGTFAGDGAGPRAMIPHVKNYILASADQVSIDAVSAHMMGFSPMKLPFIRLAHENGLGCGNFSEIEILGEDIKDVNFHFHQENTFASKGQHAIYHGPLKPLEEFLLRTVLAPWSYVASKLYHDVLWYNLTGKHRVNEMLKTPWGKLFQSY
jgi:uncharacterized protein (DUF362 family)